MKAKPESKTGIETGSLRDILPIVILSTLCFLSGRGLVAQGGEPWLVQDLNAYEPIRSVSYQYDYPVYLNGSLLLASDARGYKVREGIYKLNFFALQQSDGIMSRTANILQLPWYNAIRYMTTWRDMVLMTVVDPAANSGLIWKSDGTTGGTVPFETPDGYRILDSLTPCGDLVYFVGWKGNWGLIQSDLTTAGTRLITDLTVLKKDTPLLDPQPTRIMMDVNGVLFYAAELDDTTKGIWRTDGTESGTLLLRSFSRYRTDDIEPTEIVNVNGTAYMSLWDGENGLWKSDGTVDGTVLLKSMTASQLTAVGDTLFFSGSDAEHGRELWKCDGTVEGTVMVKDILPGPESSLIFPQDDYIDDRPFLTNVNGVLFFAANDGIHGPELWKSDVTTEETVLVANLVPDENQDSRLLIRSMHAMTDKLLFFQTAKINEYFDLIGLWVSDGTPEGTGMLRAISTPVIDQYSGTQYIRHVAQDYLIGPNGYVYFRGWDLDEGYEVWRTDGTVAGTTQVTDTREPDSPSSPKSVIAVGDTHLFTAYEGRENRVDSYRELWRIDGPMGCTRVMNNIIDFNNEGLEFQYPLKQGIVFSIKGEYNDETLRLIGDGTTSGTWRFDFGNDQIKPNIIDGELYYLARTGENSGLWKTDGSPEGTTLIRNLNFGDYYGYGSPRLVKHGGIFYFGGNDGIHGPELWKSDGTTSGTVMVADVQSGQTNYPGFLGAFGDDIFYTANDGVHGWELWASDGTSSGTLLYKDFTPGRQSGGIKYAKEIDSGIIFFRGPDIWKSEGRFNPPQQLIAEQQGNLVYVATLHDSILLFSINYEDLWRTDGTIEGTYKVLESGINEYYSGKYEDYLTPSGNMLWLTEVLQPTGSYYSSTFYIIDGTEAGSKPLFEIRSGYPPHLRFIWRYGEFSYFTFYAYGSDGPGAELWRSDGTPEGTLMLTDYPGPEGMWPSELVQLEDRLLFAGMLKDHGVRLWQTDGTPAGTRLAISEDPALTPSAVSDLNPINGRLYFSAWDEGHGKELWRTDGTLAGTERLTDIAPGPLDSNPTSFMPLRGVLYFSATDQSPIGTELYAIDLHNAATPAWRVYR